VMIVIMENIKTGTVTLELVLLRAVL